MTLVRIIGVGSPNSDDWLGWEIAERLRDSEALADYRDHYVITLHDRPGAALLEAWRDAGLVILLDAVRSGAEPGTVHRLDVEQLSRPRPTSSTHGFGVAEAVALAAALEALPETLLFYGIEADPANAELGLSPAVHAALPELVEEIESVVLSRLAGTARH